VAARNQSPARVDALTLRMHNEILAISWADSALPPQPSPPVNNKFNIISHFLSIDFAFFRRSDGDFCRFEDRTISPTDAPMKRLARTMTAPING
jgi:hypothetical protein